MNDLMVVAVVCMALREFLHKIAVQDEIDRPMLRWFALIGMC